MVSAPLEAAAGPARDDRARGAAELLSFEAVFPPAVRDSERFRYAFSQSYRRVAEEGPLAAMGAA